VAVSGAVVGAGAGNVFGVEVISVVGVGVVFGMGFGAGAGVGVGV